jgi:hypothetical protein
MRNRVDTVTAKGPAPREPLQTEQPAPPDAMRANGFSHVIGARGLKTAAAGKEWGQKNLIPAEQNERHGRGWPDWGGVPAMDVSGRAWQGAQGSRPQGC